MIDLAELNIDELEQLRDECNRRILAMRQTKGLALVDLLRLLEEVKATLTDQGKEWFSLERWQWMDGEVRFWLNPKDQDLYRTGWFSIDDLIAWSQDIGAIMIEQDFDDEESTWPQGMEVTWHPSGSTAGGRNSGLFGQ
ncbi:MAG TPA: hypothetical protein VFS21_28425 [Roseiflexaceae bacterium]|nr:hypothetical protein [Roseiflexaceae bacterium]